MFKWLKRHPEPENGDDYIKLAHRVDKLRRLVSRKGPDWKKHQKEMKTLIATWPDKTERNIRRVHHIALWLEQNPHKKSGVRHRYWLEMQRRMSTAPSETGAEIRG